MHVLYTDDNFSVTKLTISMLRWTRKVFYLLFLIRMEMEEETMLGLIEEKGPFKCYVTLFFLEIGPPPTPS